MARKSRQAEHRALLRLAHKDGTYDRLLEGQGGVCSICGAPPPVDRRFDIDHDHRTMEIRGLLCRGCNMRLRKDHKPGWLRAAADYLDRVPSGGNNGLSDTAVPAKTGEPASA